MIETTPKCSTTEEFPQVEVSQKNYQKIVWRNVLALTILHVAAIYYYVVDGLSPRIKWYHVLWPEIFGRISGLGILAGSHRLWAHRSYKARLPLRIALMLMQTMALQNDIYDWCRDHRVHHKYSDTNADPYNVRRGLFFSHIGWLMVKKHPDVINKGRNVDLSDLWKDPVVRFQRRFYIPLVVIFWGLLPTYLTHLGTGFPMLECFFGAVIFRYVVSLHCTWTVNSLAHMFGRRTYDSKMEPRENWLVTWLSWGEGYHNYHHAFPQDYRASEYDWPESFNMATLFIDFCAWFGLAYDRKRTTKQLIRKRIERTGIVEETRNFPKGNNFKKFLWTFVHYTIGLTISQYLIWITWTMRFILNGSI